MKNSLRFLLFFCLVVVGLCKEEEIKWTPNEDAENAPLPLSMNQRQQLLQLDQAIRSSPDPNGTLQKVAEKNGMSPQDLVNMLEKNNRDLAQNPSLLQPTTVVSFITKSFATLGYVILQIAKKNPKSFTVSITILIFLMYSMIMIPRTGIHITKGTTIFPPSQNYLQKLADIPGLERKSLSITNQKMKWDDLQLQGEDNGDGDGVEIHKLPKSSELSQAISGQYTLYPEDFYETEKDDDVDDDEEDGEEDTMKDNVLDLLFENAIYVLSERYWTEFAPTGQPLKSAESDRKKHGILLVPGLGILGRCGMVRYQITQQSERENIVSVTLTTLKGDFFDGQIHFEIQKKKLKKSKRRIIINIHLGIPKRGRKINKKLGMKIVKDLMESVERSISQRVRQNLARRSVGKRFKMGSTQRAKERRKSRSDREKLIEDMAEDRRRKWQRGNPNAGRWTPTGDRMRNPSGGPSRSW